MKGTEKQIAWAEDIRAEYIEMMEKEIAWLNTVIETGSIMGERNITAMNFAGVYHPEARYVVVEREMRDTDLFQKYHEIKGKTPEKKAAVKALRRAIAEESKKRLEKAVEERLVHDDAEYWIEHRMR